MTSFTTLQLVLLLIVVFSCGVSVASAFFAREFLGLSRKLRELSRMSDEQTALYREIRDAFGERQTRQRDAAWGADTEI